jgi:hypothetical protein
MSPIKEPHFFSPNYPPRKTINIIKNEQDYLSLFHDIKNETVIGEASTNYLWDPKTPNLIFSKVPDAKIIVILRDPVERAYSHYLMHYHDQVVKQSFYEIIKKIINDEVPPIVSEILNGSLYFEQIKRYYDVFGRNNIKIIIFEEFIINTKQIMEEILSFLNLKNSLNNFFPEVHNPYGIIKSRAANKIRQSKIVHSLAKIIFSKSQREFLNEKLIFTKKTKPLIDEDSRSKLIEYYYQDVQLLEAFLQRKLPWQNFTNYRN